MNRIMITTALMITIFTMSCNARPCCGPKAAEPKEVEPKTCSSKPKEVKQAKPDITTLDGVLEKLRLKTAGMKNLTADIEYLFIKDPDDWDVRTIQKGIFYYQKQKDRSKIRINFDRKKNEDEDEEKNLEQFIFDGVWVIRIDYDLKTIKYDQQAKKDKPIEAFEFINQSFPMIGFTKTEELQKHFKIDMLENNPKDPNALIHLRLKPKPKSKYVKDYSRLEFWIDKKTFLPSRLKTATIKTDTYDVYDIKFKNMKANKKVAKDVFKVDVPKDFVENRRPLEEQQQNSLKPATKNTKKN